MRKLKLWITITAVLCCVLFAFPMTGMAKGGFSIVVEAMDGADTIMPGYTYTYRVLVKQISESDGLLGLQNVTVVYDHRIYETPSLDDVTGDAIDGWQMDRTVSTPGVIILNPNEINGDAAHAVSKDSIIAYTIRLKVKDDAPSEQTVISVTKGTGTSTSLGSVEAGFLGSLTVKFRQKLPAPSGLAWSGNTATWKPVAGADDYAVQLYRNTEAVDDAVSTGGAASFDFSDRMTASGSYTFRVTAVSGAAENEDSDESMQSPMLNVVGQLATPKIKLMPDFTSGGLKYQITDTNPTDSVSAYFIELYREGSSTPVKSISVTADKKAGSLPADGKALIADKAYGATVKAVSAVPGANHDSGVSEISTYITAVDVVSSMEIKSLPTTTYTEGEALDLIGLSVTVVYRSGVRKTVLFADFEDNGILVSMKSGTPLAFADNGKSITISYASAVSCSFQVSVVSSACEHTATDTVYTAPTCAGPGSERTVCRICHAVLNETVLPQSTEHSFAGWEIVNEATSTADGLQKRVCTVCGTIDEEVIPALGEITDDTVSPDENGDNDDENGDDDPEDDHLDDVSKAFLIVVIIVFSLAILAIIGIIYLRRKREEELQKKRKTTVTAARRNGQTAARGGKKQPAKKQQPKTLQGAGKGGNRR